MVKELIFVALRFSGLPFVIREVFQRRAVTILVYHRLQPAIAERHFRVLTRLYTPISLQDYLASRRNATCEQLPRKSIVVTIDDGHSSVSHLKTALTAHRIPATVFLCSGFVGENRRFWFSAPGLTATRREQLKTIPDQARLAVLRASGFDEAVEYSQRDSLDRDEVKQLLDVAEFQSHSVSHPILPMCSEDKARDEIADSKRQLQETLGVKVNALAYPNGSYTERETRLAQQAGYECGLTMSPGFNGPKTPPFELKRVAMPDDCGVHELIVRSCGVWAFFRELKLMLTGDWARRSWASAVQPGALSGRR
jgi:poly-beta-1,6-N-acetyl-D-glucosamine N-deacetylase